MLLTLATRSFADALIAGHGDEPSSMLDLPEFTSRQLKLRGLNVIASMLSGWSFEELDRLRDCADKAACPCLVLIEDTPIHLGTIDEQKNGEAVARVHALAAAANRLGCNAVAISVNANDEDESFDRVTQTVKDLIPAIERHELNLLLAPHKGLTFEPDRMIEVIKRIGGFRIGALPNFAHAVATGDTIATLRKLAPYAGAIHASIAGFDKQDRHQDYDLTECVFAIRSVGFLNTLAIEYSGSGDPVENIEKARTILAAAIEAEME
jgi:hypothetical protein